MILVNESYSGARLFVSGQNDNPYCSKVFPALSSNQLASDLSQSYFHIPIAHCDMQLEPNVSISIK